MVVGVPTRSPASLVLCIVKPETGHGYEFKEITRLVGIRSNGFFDIHRLADEDDMSGFVMKEKYVKMVEKRKSNKKKGLTAVLSYYNDGEILLTTTSSQSLIEKLCANVNMDYYGRKKLVKVVVCNDSRLISVLFDNNYTVDFRTCKGWPVKGSEWLKLLDYMDKAVYKNKNYVDTNESTRRGNINKIITEIVNDFINKKKDNGVVSLSPDVNYSEVSPFGK